MIGGLVLNIVLASIFFVMRVIEWHSLNFNWKADAQGSYVWAFLGLHSFDYVGDLVFTIVLLIIILSGRYGEKQRLGVHVDSVVWYFLDCDLDSHLRRHLLGSAHCGDALITRR